MRRILSSTLLFAAFGAAASLLCQTPDPPKTWVDPSTRHRIVRLTDEPGSASLYFNQNGYTADGSKLLFTTANGISTLDLKTHETKRVVEGRVRVVEAGRKTQNVYYVKQGVVYSTNVDTGAMREIAKLPPRGSVSTVNADETLIAGTYIEGGGQDYNANRPQQPQTLDQPVNKGQMMEQRLAARLPMAMFTVNVKTGELKVIHKSTDWLNHLLFSPADPSLLMFCHEGPWHKIERIWTIRTDGGDLRKIHTRTMEMEIFGHEFWSADGKTIWYDLQTPRGELFWVAGYNVETGRRIWYHLDRNEWSIHFNVTRDGALFCGDGGDSGQVAHAPNGRWIYLFRPQRVENRGVVDKNLVTPGSFRAERLVDMAKHEYRLEPNVSFTPDQKWIVFRSNMFGPTYVFAVEVAPADRQAAEFKVGDYGAAGDGRTVDTPAIQKAIDAAARAGSGAVTFKPGVYLSGAIFVKSGVHLRVDEGVEIRAVPDLAAFPIMQTRIAGVEMKWPSALINVYEQKGVRISGNGTIDGDGRIWWDKYWRMRKEEYEPKGLRWAADYDCMRVRLIQIYRSSGVDLRGLTLKRSGFWTVQICYSDKVTAADLTIRNNIDGRGPSTDGIDIDSSSNVLVERCDIDCNDDAICLKAGRDADGLRVNRPTEKVIVRDCVIRGGAAGLTIGSETSGGIRDIEAYRLRVLAPVSNGILFKSANTRGGTIDNIDAHQFEIEGVSTPIRVNLNWNPAYSYATLPAGAKDVPDHWRALTEKVPPEKGMPHFRNVRISDIKASGAVRAIEVAGYKEAPLEDFQFKNLDIEAKSAGSIQHARNWTFTNVAIRTVDGSRVAVNDSENIQGLPQ